MRAMVCVEWDGVGFRELGDERHENKGALPVVDRSSRGLVRCLEAIDRPLCVHDR